jgi:hypothetical protein
MFTGMQARMEIVRMPLKKKDRDRLFEKDLEKGKKSTVAHYNILMTNCTYIYGAIEFQTAGLPVFVLIFCARLLIDL